MFAPDDPCADPYIDMPDDPITEPDIEILSFHILILAWFHRMSNGNLGCLAFDVTDVRVTEFSLRAHGRSHKAEPSGIRIARLFLRSLPLLEDRPCPASIRGLPDFIRIFFRSCLAA